MRYYTPASLLAILVVSLLSGAPIAAPDLAAFNPQQTHGDVRVTLVSVDRSVVFNDQFVATPLRGHQKAAPVLRTVLVIEHLADGPGAESRPSMADVRLVQGGQAVPERDGCIPGGVDAVHPYATEYRGLHMPPVANPDRAYIQDLLSAGLAAGERHSMDLEIKCGFGDTTQTFLFKRIPLY